MLKKTTFYLVYCLLAFSTQFSFAQITSDFTTNDDGWTCFNTSTGASIPVVYNGTGGNPNGNISFGTTSGSVGFYWIAPAKFLGNLSRSYGQNLSFDLKVSIAGTDNSIGDLIITNAATGASLYYQLPTKPTFPTPAWSSYSVQLTETFSGWHYGSIAGVPPTKDQLKFVLSNITKLQIRLKYNNTNTFTVTGFLDNVVLNVAALGTPPIVTSFAPLSALAGTSVIIAGSNFNTTLSQNFVYFKGVKAAVTNATATQLTVTVPKSAPYGQITVVNLATGLQGTSTQNFNLLFDNNKDFGGRIIPASMTRGYNTLISTTGLSNNFGSVDKGDFDGDGWVDIIVTETQGPVTPFPPSIYIFRNLGAGGTVSTSSFSSAISLPGLATVPGGSPTLANMMVADVDSDGKLDVAASIASGAGGGQGYLAVFRNTSSAGTVSFATPLFFAYPYYNPLTMAGSDLDSDGRIDFMFVTGSSGSSIWVNQNLSTPGNIDFAYGLALGTVSSYGDLAVGDLNGDNKPEIVASNYSGSTLTVYQNTSTPGAISIAAPFTVASPVANAYVAIADLDGDTKQDLAWCAYGATNIYVAQNIYSGPPFDALDFASTITIASAISNPNGIAAGDINADGKTDVVITGYSDMGIMQNISTAGTLNINSFLPTIPFQASATGQALYGLGPVIADLDGDNKPEVVLASSNGVPASEKGIYIFHNESFPVPRIDTATPSSGNAGTLIALTGDLMKSGNAAPTARFGNLSVNATATNNTTTTLTIPTGAQTDEIALTEHGLTGFSKPLPVTFTTSRQINTTSFGSGVKFNIAFSPRDVLTAADFDDDGKTDVAVSDNNGVEIFKNATSAGAVISTSSLSLLGTTLSTGTGMIALDADGDGKIDLNNGSGLLQNSSSLGSISFLSAPGGINTSVANYVSAASGDFNKDGKVDIAVTNGTSFIQVYENRSSKGAFVNNGILSTYSTTAINLAKPSANGGIVAADFDGDGYDDLIATNPATNNFSIYLNTAKYGGLLTSSFSLAGTTSTGLQPYGISANDFDGDGKTDLAVTYYNQAYVSVYRNTSSVGNISFAANVDLICNNKGYNITSQDLDGDGKSEIIIIHQPNPGPGSFSVFKNNSTSGTISFASVVNFALTNNPQALAIADINSDQKPDILIVGSGGSGQALMVFENKIATPVISITTQPLGTYSACDGATTVISTAAAGAANITYQWQVLNTATNVYVDLTNTSGYSNVSTSSLTINSTGNFGSGTYRCKVDGDFASTNYTNLVSFSVNPIPAAPSVINVNNCGPASFTLNVSGGTNGLYYWYDSNGLITGQVNNSYTTPLISTTTSYQVALTDGICVSPKVTITASINSIPVAPTITNAASCGPGSLTLNAAGGVNGQYRWYTASTGGTAIAGEVNSSYTTPSIATTAIYYVAINIGSCESTRTALTATINTVPTAPTTTGANSCSAATMTLNAAGGVNGQYRWYTTSTGGTAIAGEVNSTYATPTLTSTTIYYVSINNGSCEGARTAVTATISSTACNLPPVITPAPQATRAGGEVDINLSTLISDPNNNLDLTTLTIIKQPDSKAIATIDANANLRINYQGIVFSGTDKLTIQVCDLAGACTQQIISIEVAGSVNVYNAVSPNGDGKNDFFYLQYIEIIASTKNNHLSIYNRWGDEVFSISNYNNTSNVFSGVSSDGKLLPAGTYFYKVTFTSSEKSMTGYIELKY